MSIPEYRKYKKAMLDKIRKQIIKLCDLCDDEVASIYSKKYRINICKDCESKL